jgi:hypothetical protein
MSHRPIVLKRIQDVRRWLRAAANGKVRIRRIRDLPRGVRRVHMQLGYIAQWLERLTADQQVPGSNPGVPSWESVFGAGAGRRTYAEPAIKVG